MYSGARTSDGGVQQRHDEPADQSLAAQLRHARRLGFVGRTSEIDDFRARLAGELGPVVLVHGPAGIGKTALLERFAVEAESAGRPVLRLDGASPPAPSRVEASTVVLLDGLEASPGLQDRLREHVLPALPRGVVVVAAGRDRPSAEWYADLGWRALVEVRRLEPLGAAESAELLGRYDVHPGCVRTVVEFAAGNPLALCLAADDLARTAGEAPGAVPSTSLPAGATSSAAAVPSPQRTGRVAPSRRLVASLLDRMLDPAPDAGHDLALRVAAHARHLTVDLLRAVLDEDVAVEAFARLGGLPFVETAEHGLRVDDLVGRLVDSDHRWRDPAAYGEMHRSLWRHLSSRLTEPGRAAGPAAVDDLLHLQRYRHPERHERAGFRSATDQRPLPGDPAPGVRALAAEHLGEQDAGHVERWLARDPDAFTVFGVGERPTSFVAWLRLTEPPGSDPLGSDPVVTATWQQVALGMPLAPGEEVGLVRFVVPRPAAGHLEPHDPRLAHCAHRVARDHERLAATYVALPDPDPCEPVMDVLGHRLEARVTQPDSPTWGVFGHDWREVDLAEHLVRAEPPVGVGPTAATATCAWSRDALESAVRQALRDFGDAETLASNPLTRAGVGAHLRPDDPVEALREALRSAVDRLADDPRLAKAHRAVVATHLERSTTQEATAQRLDLPFSTYRRHLAKATALVCDRMWSQVQGGSHGAG